jgi:putative CocE/NonD family hydrolase
VPGVLHNLLVPMRDGARLALDLVRPPGDGPWPVVLVRTCYDKVLVRDLAPGTARGIPYDSAFLDTLAGSGYALAVQDVRGRFNSDGEWYPYAHELEDGHDTVAWIAEQEWCDGSVGMVGRSYAAYTQWTAAVTNPTGLKAIVPIAAQPDLWEAGFPLSNGVFNLPMAEFLVKMGRRSFQVADFMGNVFQSDQDYFETLPMSELPRAAGAEPARWWTDMTGHPNRDAYWRGMAYDASLAEAPALNISGWYDLCLPGALEGYRRVRQGDGPAAARDGARLVVGPWAHWADIVASTGEIDFGEAAVVGLGETIVGFLDSRLRAVATPDEPRVRVFVMGENAWRSADDWPLPGTRYVPFWLHSGGAANTADGDGALSTEEPGPEPPDAYEYDPLDPVVGSWSMLDGPVDDREVAQRRDVLCFTSEALVEPLDVVGPLAFVLYAASSARDTDWHARLVDVHPSGYAQFLAHGVLRARFRHSVETPELLTPGEVERFEIDLGATANRFLPGHRIRLELTSSWFPRYERNLNSGAENTFTDATAVVATQTVYHEPGRSSHVLLPVV